jgi:hypothetical protein
MNMNWRYGQPIANGHYLCCVRGSSFPISAYWKDGYWGYYEDRFGDWVTFDTLCIVCYIGFDEIPMPEGW